MLNTELLAKVAVKELIWWFVGLPQLVAENLWVHTTRGFFSITKSSNKSTNEQLPTYELGYNKIDYHWR